MSQIPYKGPDTLLSAALASPHPLLLCVGGSVGAHGSVGNLCTSPVTDTPKNMGTG